MNVFTDLHSYGITRVLEGGDLLEKAAANVSIVRGHLSDARAKAGTTTCLSVFPHYLHFSLAEYVEEVSAVHILIL